MIENKIALDDEELDGVSGGAGSPAGAVMLCTAAAPLFKNNPAGTHFRSEANTMGTLQPGTTVKLFEYGPQYCKVVGDGKVGWVETVFLKNA